VQLQPVEFSSLPQAALEFLNQGGSPQQLDQALYRAGFASLPVPVDTADMTGDGREEAVVAIFDPASSNMPPAGSLLIYECQAGEYQLACRSTPRTVSARLPCATCWILTPMGRLSW
jgi:hypothetical protein